MVSDNVIAGYLFGGLLLVAVALGMVWGIVAALGFVGVVFIAIAVANARKRK